MTWCIGQLHPTVYRTGFGVFVNLRLFLSLVRSKLRLWSANHRAGYFSNLACDWLSIVWAYSAQETENGHWCWVSLCVPFTNSLIEFNFIMRVVTIIGILWPFFLFWTTCLGFLQLSSSGSANAHIPGCFRTWTFPLNIGLNMLPSGSFMPCLDSLLGYLQGTSWLCNWLSLRCLVLWINRLLHVCWSTFWKSSLKQATGLDA